MGAYLGLKAWHAVSGVAGGAVEQRTAGAPPQAGVRPQAVAQVLRHAAGQVVQHLLRRPRQQRLARRHPQLRKRPPARHMAAGSASGRGTSNRLNCDR